MHLHVRTCTPLFHISRMARRIVFKFCVNSDKLDNCFAHVWCGVHLHVRTCIPLGGTEQRLVKLPATRTTNLRSAALPQKRCLAGNRRLVEHRDNNYSLELLFSQWETNLSYRNRGLIKQLCWRFRQVAPLNNWRSLRRENFTQYALAGDLSNGVGRDPVKNLVRLVLAKYFLR